MWGVSSMVGLAFLLNVSGSIQETENTCQDTAGKYHCWVAKQSCARSKKQVRTYIFLEKPKEVLRH